MQSRLTLGQKVIDANRPYQELCITHCTSNHVVTDDGRTWEPDGYLYGSRATRLLLIESTD